MRIALICPGLGRTARGYERFASELFAAARSSVDLTLFKGEGNSGEREVAVGGPGRDSVLAQALERVARDKYWWESFFFALRLRKRLASFDVVHYSEPPLNLVLTRLGPARARRLFSHALNMGVEHTLRCHHIHQTSPDGMSEAARLGIPEDRMTLLPYGVWTDSFSERPDRAERERVRNRYGLPAQEPVVLCVAALNRSHKRVDHLIAELGRMEARPHLLLCGTLDDPTVLEEARRTLGPEAVTHAYVTASEMGSLYRASDLFVLPSLVEGFGLGVIEAQLSGLPVVAHDSTHFRWLLGEDSEQLVDMSSPGALAGKLELLLADLPKLQERASARRLRQVQRYDWKSLLPDYIAMYARAAAHPPTLIESLVDGR